MRLTDSTISVTDSGLGLSTQFSQLQVQQDRVIVYPAPQTLASQATFNAPNKTLMFDNMSAASQKIAKAFFDDLAAQYQAGYGK
jgi:hypothetical protein